MKYILSASILSADFGNLQNEIRTCELAGVDWIHIDVMDGHFVPNLTMGPFIVETVRRITPLPIDCHLMIENPENLVESFAKSGATNITIHPENNPKIVDTLTKIRSLGCKAGIAINPATPVNDVRSLVEYADLFLIMTVNPGYSGQKFMPETISKIKEISDLIRSCKDQPFIEVDGGINTDTIKQTRDAGANSFVSASAIFRYPQGILEGVRVLRDVLD